MAAFPGRALIDALTSRGDCDDPSVERLCEEALRDTITHFEATGSPIMTDGEQRKYHNFWTYSVEGLPNTAPDGFKIPFAAGHVRRMPRLTSGPFRYERYADAYVVAARRYTQRPLKQAVISPSALSLLYPAEGLQDYPRARFIEDLICEHVHEVRRCLDRGAAKVQIDFTEGRLAIKVDPTGGLLAEYIPLEQLGTTDDCGFSPFCDDVSTSRETAFAKIRARVLGTALAERRLGVR